LLLLHDYPNTDKLLLIVPARGLNQSVGLAMGMFALALCALVYVEGAAKAEVATYYGQAMVKSSRDIERRPARNSIQAP
jgi:hypothetical protein